MSDIDGFHELVTTCLPLWFANGSQIFIERVFHGLAHHGASRTLTPLQELKSRQLVLQILSISDKISNILG